MKDNNNNKKKNQFHIILIELIGTETLSFHCRVVGFPTPDISWQKDGLSIENNPDYQTCYYNGVCSLTIDETFAEDSAKFVCIARNSSGAAETSAFLSITGE